MQWSEGSFVLFCFVFVFDFVLWVSENKTKLDKDFFVVNLVEVSKERRKV